ncbi:MAG: peptide deformylase [bacterium]|nr:peptide deformylase [bacterium]
MKSIVQMKDPVLRKKALDVPVKDIGSEKIRRVISEMKEALATQDDGVAIAAPQIGASLRIFVVSGTMMKMADKEYKGDGSDMIFINPEITKLSRKKNEAEEGCLSVRWKYGKVKRSEKASIKAYDENGRLFERGSSGLLAQVFQHETDHLNGVLFIDKAYDVRDIPPEM